MIAGFIYKGMGARFLMITSFIISTIFGIALYFLMDYKELMVYIVLGMRFGIGFSFNGVFLITLDIFPARYKGTIFGSMGLLSNVTGILGPIIAE